MGIKVQLQKIHFHGTRWLELLVRELKLKQINGRNIIQAEQERNFDLYINF